MNKDRDDWVCTSCKWEGPVIDIIKKQVYAATREEPDEWLWYCPDCNATDSLQEKYEYATWCCLCEDEIVQDPGDICFECQVSKAEMLADAAKGH